MAFVPALLRECRWLPCVGRKGDSFASADACAREEGGGRGRGVGLSSGADPRKGFFS